MTEFEKFDYDFRNKHMGVFNNNPKGLLWLKVRAISRGKQLLQFASENNIVLKSSNVGEQNIELYEILTKRKDAMAILDSFLQCMNNEWYTRMGVNIDQLKEDLYKVREYSWGGDHNNSLDKYFISRYVKVISDYSELYARQTEIGMNAWKYVQNSWYNNWTSFVIESLFKRNPKVISAVGEIKSVDFFIEDYPLDLKVTFFPTQFMEQKLKISLGKNELSWLKEKCKVEGISCDPKSPPCQQYYTLIQKLKELNYSGIINELEYERRKIITDAQNDPTELIQWLYENQGEMRFGAENRIYLILADLEDLTRSWKMKRAFSIIEPKINKYINDFSSRSLKTINFVYKKMRYSALSDILFIVK